MTTTRNQPPPRKQKGDYWYAKEYRIPFGLYKGQDLKDIPSKYLEYLVRWKKLRPYAKKALKKELSRRRGPISSGPIGPEVPHGTDCPFDTAEEATQPPVGSFPPATEELALLMGEVAPPLKAQLKPKKKQVWQCERCKQQAPPNRRLGVLCHACRFAQ